MALMVEGPDFMVEGYCTTSDTGFAFPRWMRLEDAYAFCGWAGDPRGWMWRLSRSPKERSSMERVADHFRALLEGDQA